MSSQGMFSIGGIASGLDTSGIIDQLMALERQPIRRLENTQARLRQVDTAWTQVTARLAAVRAAVDSINSPTRFSSMVAVTSSDTDAVAVSKAAAPGTGSLSFSVGQLAQSHQVASGTFASATEALGLTGTFEVAVGDGQAVSIALTGDETLDGLAQKLNAAKGGFTTTVVKQDDGAHRLVMTADKTGAANNLTITAPAGATQFESGLRTLRVAQNAEVTLGSGADAITLSRASNTITDLVPGASITLKKVTDGQSVTVTAARDVEAAVKAVKEYAEAVNGAVDLLARLTKYDPETKQAGLLQGAPMARQLLNNLRSAATAPLGVELAGVGSAAEVGLSVDRYGKVQLDDTKLRAALNDDFDAVGRLFGRHATATDARATDVVGTNTPTAGVHQVEITAAATAAKAVGATYTPPGDDSQPKTFRVMSGGSVAVVTIDTSHATAADVVAALNQALEAASIASVRARVGDGGEGDLVLEESRFGSAAGFTVEEIVSEEDQTVVEGGAVWGLEGTYTGTDVEGTIGGIEAVGTGRSLKAVSGAAEGISLTWTGTEATTAPFGVTFTHGLAGAMGNTLRQAEGVGGLVSQARKGLTNQIEVYQSRIDGFEQRLSRRESTLRRQFTAMESALSQLNAQGSWLTSQLSSLNGLSQQQR
ncbi:MAG: flagellar filament capping protein FliD [Actinobacteria bacterium]|jgi:flagellar hook-associated protein 2|nr:flagellar filament capping protein FliD [Actinomycetota bacterium]